MLGKYKMLLLGAMLGVGTLAFSGAGLAAAGMFPAAPLGPADTMEGNSGFIQVADGNRGNMEWDRERDGDRCLHRDGRCHHFHNWYYYENPWWTFPLIIGNGYGYDDGYDDYGYDRMSDRHVEWCLDHYRSYNPRTNTWVSHSGVVHECISPYA